jgi:hypothetical protein
MLIVGYTIATVPIVDENGQPPLASSAFFAVLCGVYFFFSTITGIIIVFSRNCVTDHTETH